MEYTKRQINKAKMNFRFTVAMFIESQPGACSGGPGYQYRIQTPLGPMHINVEDTSVYCRFICRRSASIWNRAVYSANGSWNHRFTEKQILEGYCSDVVISEFKQLLNYTPNKNLAAMVAHEIGEENSKRAKRGGTRIPLPVDVV